MSVWLEKPRHRQDGRHKVFGRTTVRSAFQNFVEILSWFEPRLDSVVQSSGRWHFSCTQFPYQGFARPNQGNGHPDGWLDVCNFHINSSRVRTKKAVVRTSEFWMRNLPYGWASPDKIHLVRTVAVIFPYLCFGKKSHSWSNTDCLPDVLLKCPDGCKLEQFEASWHRGRSGRKDLVVRMDDAWTVERPDGISHHLDGCQGTEINCHEIFTESSWRT
jgi:hypothetical protein